MKGDLADFPFHAHRSGDFRIAAQVDDLVLDYMPGAAPAASPWPPLTQARGEIVLDRGALAFSASQAQILGVAIDGLKGGIADLFEQRVLSLRGRARGPLGDMLRFVAATPLDGWTGGALRETTASADGELALTRSPCRCAVRAAPAPPAACCCPAATCGCGPTCRRSARCAAASTSASAASRSRR